MDKKFIYTGKVKSVNDPLMMNRVRVSFDTIIDNANDQSILDGVPDTYDGKETKDSGDLKPEFQWTKLDPFCCLPLIPVLLKTTPKVGESVNIMWPNPEYKFGEQYYIQGVFSSILTSYREDAASSRLFASRDRLQGSVYLKNPENGEYYLETQKGIFAEPDDVALQGRGTCDLILKDDDVILRAGKSKSYPLNRNTPIEFKKTRSFLQLSNFSDRINFNGNIPQLRLEPNVQFVKTLIEWNIGRPENLQDNFDLEVYIYGLPENSAYTTNQITISSEINDMDKALILKLTYNNLTSQQIIDKINKVLKQSDNAKINLDPYPITRIRKPHPIVFRPNKMTYKWISDANNSTLPEYKNVIKIAEKIKFKKEGKEGYGLLFSPFLVGQQTTPRIDYTKDISRQNVSTTYGVMGADKLVFLSHESEINGKKIILDESTAVKLEQGFLAESVLPYTNSLVRGEELIKFMNLIVKFLISHVHAFPGLPPVPVATDGTSSAKILTELQNANKKILNQNIRIN
jgi:hypothetical protein